MKAMAKGTELRIDWFGNFCWEAFQNIFVALQAGSASRSAPLTAMSPAVEMINDKIHVSEPGCHGRCLPLLVTHSLKMTSIVMHNGLQPGQSVSHLRCKVVPLGQALGPNDFQHVKEQTRLGHCEQISGASGSCVGLLLWFLVRFARAPAWQKNIRHFPGTWYWGANQTKGSKKKALLKPRHSCFGATECQGPRKVRGRRGLKPVHLCLRAWTLLSRRRRMLLSARLAKCCANTSALMVQAGCHPRKPAIWTSKWQTSPCVCKAFRRRCRATWDEGGTGGSCLSRAAACFWHKVSFPCGRQLQPRSRNLCKWGLGTTSAKGMPHVRRCSLALPSIAKMSARSWEASNCARRLTGRSHGDVMWAFTASVPIRGVSTSDLTCDLCVETKEAVQHSTGNKNGNKTGQLHPDSEPGEEQTVFR